MRKTKVDHKIGLIGAMRKIRQTATSPVCLPLDQDEAEAVMAHLRRQKDDLLLRRKEWLRDLVPLATELGGTLAEETTLPEELRLTFTSFVGKVKLAAEGVTRIQYSAEEAESYNQYLAWMDRQIEDLFEMTRVARKETVR
jgi:hypothetical protein